MYQYPFTSEVPIVNRPTVVWPGYGWREIPFLVYPLWTEFPALPGLYIPCWQLPDGRWFAEYVGETDSFKRRVCDEFRSHDFWLGATAHRATHICVRHVPGGKAERLALETELRHMLTPPCNKQ
jgi:hypothetical protein